MKLTLQKINKSLSPSFHALKSKRDEVDKFKKSLAQYFKVTDSSESEENLKTHLMDFLKNHFSPEHLIEQIR
jgi:TFIIF-interacting CTD phosphatase-like protein